MTNLADLFRELKLHGLNREDCIVAAYYWLEMNHSGQWSWEYEALSRLGRVFAPGCSGFEAEEPWFKEIVEAI